MIRGVLVVVFTLLGLSAAQYGAQTAVNVSFGDASNKPTWLWSLVHLPADYNTTTTQYPLLVFFHGAGEVTHTRALSELQIIATTFGPCHEVYKGNPLEFTVNGVLHKFIAVCPQFYTSGYEGKWDRTGVAGNNFISAIIAKYRVDLSRVYLTGLSDGGYSAMAASVNSAAHASRYAAVALVDFSITVTFLNPGMCNLAANGVGLWVSCGDQDDVISYDSNHVYVKTYNACPKTCGLTGVFNTMYGGEHDDLSFNGAYATNHTFYHPNLYEWVLLHKRGTSPATVPPTPRPPGSTPAPTPKPTQAPTCGTPSAFCTTVTDTTGAICDDAGNKWTITSTKKVALNGVTDQDTSNVVAIEYIGAVLWQKNTGGEWYGYFDGVWYQSEDDPTNPACTGASYPTVSPTTPSSCLFVPTTSSSSSSTIASTSSSSSVGATSSSTSRVSSASTTQSSSSSTSSSASSSGTSSPSASSSSASTSSPSSSIASTSNSPSTTSSTPLPSPAPAESSAASLAVSLFVCAAVVLIYI